MNGAVAAVARGGTSRAGPPGNLPAEPNAFIGRDRDLAELAVLLDRARLVTLCGPGGIGKTRLALRLAAMAAPRHPDGAWLADLAEADPAGPPGHLAAWLAAALGIRPETGRPIGETLAAALRGRAALLVLDTCEPHVRECAALAERLLAQCPRLRILATSREPLRARGEVAWRVPPLGLPQDGEDPAAAAGSEAVRLFLARAAAVRPGFSLTGENAPAIAGICRTLDGVPLAIELAAARVRALSVPQIAERLAGRFALLALGDRTAPPRQQTLRATAEWSLGLLTDAERRLLARLSVFRGWTLEMAERVCADAAIPAAVVLDLLTALIDKSLVSVEPEVGGSARYRLADMVREIAAEQAGEAGELDRLRLAHRDCMLQVAEQIASRAFVRGAPSWPERVAMYARARAERANFHLALGLCAERGDAREGLRLCHALAGSWLASGEVADGARWLDQMIRIGGQAPAVLRARARAVRAELAFEQQDYDGAARHARSCLSLGAREDGSRACALRILALVALMAGQAREALGAAQAAVGAARQAGDEWEEGVALATCGVVLAAQGRLAEAEDGFRQALEVLRGNNGWGVANALYGLGRVARARGDPAAAVRCFEEALGIYRQIDARPEMARCLAGMGLVALAGQDLPRAREHLGQSLRLSLATGQRLPAARGLAAFAALAVASGEPEKALRLAGAARALLGEIGARSPAPARRLDEVTAAAGAGLGAAAAAALAAEGATLALDDAVRLALGGPGTPAGAGPGPAGPGPLSEREVQVARLVAEGLSNLEIGRRLFISQATVARHVANIFLKLGLRGRAQLAAWAAGQALPAPAAAPRGAAAGAATHPGAQS